MRIVFRTDASMAIGHGHVMRCLTLAGALRKRGAEVSFISRAHAGHLCDLIAERGFTLGRLPPPVAGRPVDESPAHAGWLGVSWQEDAEQTRDLIETLDAPPDWLIVDHYALDRRWEGEARGPASGLMVIDDLADRPHDCDLLLDQNLVPSLQTRYDDKVPATCGRLLGPEYALLHPVYAELHDRMPPREGPVRRILISFGGADASNVTGLAVSAFASLGRSDIIADVVLSAGSPHTRSLRAQVEGLPNIDLYHGLPTLAPLIARADLAIGAGGATTWERLCLGLPTLLVTLAANQHAIARELDERGLVRWLGDQEALEQSELARVLDEILAEGLSADWSRRCLARVDGGGTRRVAVTLMSDAMTPLNARHATPRDERLLLDWANDPLTRANAFSPDPITPQVHKEWFRQRLREIDACRLYIIQTEEEVPIGQVRFERAEDGWEVHYALAPLFRGRRLGLPMLRSALATLPPDESARSLFGKVKIDNKPSQRIFEHLGFTRELLADEEMLVYRRALA